MKIKHPRFALVVGTFEALFFFGLCCVFPIYVYYIRPLFDERAVLPLEPPQYPRSKLVLDRNGPMSTHTWGQHRIYQTKDPIRPVLNYLAKYVPGFTFSKDSQRYESTMFPYGESDKSVFMSVDVYNTWNDPRVTVIDIRFEWPG